MKEEKNMEENKNVQNNVELTDEQLEKTAGGLFLLILDDPNASPEQTCPSSRQA